MYPNDETLVEALIEEDEEAYRYAIKTYHALMLGLARSIAGDNIADEVVQEAWVSVLRALPDFEGNSSLKTWILKIVANEAKGRRRKERRSVSFEETFGENDILVSRFNDNGQWIPRREPVKWCESSPQALICRDELRDCIQLAIADLPDAQAATFRLRELAGCNFKEICNILDVSESNVRVLLHRARTRLFSAIDHFESSGECCESDGDEKTNVQTRE